MRTRAAVLAGTSLLSLMGSVEYSYAQWQGVVVRALIGRAAVGRAAGATVARRVAKEGFVGIMEGVANKGGQALGAAAVNSLLATPTYSNPSSQDNYNEWNSTSGQYYNNTAQDDQNYSVPDYDNQYVQQVQCEVIYEQRWVGRTFTHREITSEFFDGYNVHYTYRDFYRDDFVNVPVSSC